MMLTIVKLVPKYRLTVESVVIGFQRSMNRSCVFNLWNSLVLFQSNR